MRFLYLLLLVPFILISTLRCEDDDGDGGTGGRDGGVADAGPDGGRDGGVADAGPDGGRTDGGNDGGGCVDEIAGSGVATEGPMNGPGPFDYRQTCDRLCPDDLRPGGAPDDPCTSSTQCAETCCDCPEDGKSYPAAACLNGTCRYPETVCHVVLEYVPTVCE